MMKILGIAAISAALLFVGCTAEQGGNGAADVSRKAVSLFEEIGTSLKGVTDEEKAKAALPGLEGLTAKLGPIMDQLKSLASSAMKGDGKGGGDLGAIGKGLADKAKSAFSGPLKDVMAKVNEQIARITKDPKLLEPLKGVISKLQSFVKP